MPFGFAFGFPFARPPLVAAEPVVPGGPPLIDGDLEYIIDGVGDFISGDVASNPALIDTVQNFVTDTTGNYISEEQ